MTKSEHKITIRLNDEYYNYLIEKTSYLDMDKSKFIRAAMMNQLNHIKIVEDKDHKLQDILQQYLDLISRYVVDLTASANNINQIARKMNQNGDLETDNLKKDMLKLKHDLNCGVSSIKNSAKEIMKLWQSLK